MATFWLKILVLLWLRLATEEPSFSWRPGERARLRRFCPGEKMKVGEAPFFLEEMKGCWADRAAPYPRGYGAVIPSPLF